jgi:hypothetical protein
MFKTIALSLLLSVSFLMQNAIGQTIAKELTQAEQFSTQSGVLIEKQFIKVGFVKGVEVSIIKFKDLNSGTSKKALRFEYEYKSQYSSDTKIASLDADEIDGLVKTIKNFQATVFTETRSFYTEVTYRSRTGFEAGAYYQVEKKKWTAYIKLEKYDKNAMVYLSVEDFQVLGSLIEQAQTISFFED